MVLSSQNSFQYQPLLLILGHCIIAITWQNQATTSCKPDCSCVRAAFMRHHPKQHIDTAGYAERNVKP